MPSHVTAASDTMVLHGVPEGPMGKREYEDSLAGIGRKIDNTLNAWSEWRSRVRNRLATGGLFERFRRPSGGPKAGEKVAERVAALREELEASGGKPKVLLAAFGAGAVLVAVAMLVLVFGFGLFRGTGLTRADLERDAQLRQAAERARAEQQGTLNPAAMMMQQEREAALEAEASSGGAKARPGG